MLGWARERGISKLSLMTEGGSKAVRFYERAGWTRVGTNAGGEARFEYLVLG